MKIVWLLLCLITLDATGNAGNPGREYYELTIYHFTKAAQEQAIDQYLEEAWLPALHRQGIRSIGIFKPITNDTATTKTIYVIVPYMHAAQKEKTAAALLNDPEFLQKGKAYLEAPWDQPPYQRISVQWLKAFHLAPKMEVPDLSTPKSDHIYELRSYEGPTEALYRNKVQMFNEGGEIVLFKRLTFNAVFYAEVLSGNRMPNLIYMTSFENRESREQHWRTFSEDAEWKRLSALPEYQHNVSKADIILMRAAPYSDY